MSNFIKSCRSCLAVNAELNLFECIDGDFDVKLSEIFEVCTNIVINEEDNDFMPNFLCLICLDKFRVAYKLVKQCKEIDEQLKIKCIKIEEIYNEEVEAEELSENYTDYEGFEFLDSTYDDEEETESIVKYADDGLDCEICGTATESITALEQHYKTHNRSKMPCTLCRKMILNVQAHMKNHLPTVSLDGGQTDTIDEEYQYNCTVCAKKFHAERLLRLHVVDLHDGKDDIPCLLCSRKFTNYKYFMRHMLRMHCDKKPKEQVMYRCDVCDKLFKNRYSLEYHKDVHFSEKKYKCELCDKSFLREEGRKMHMRTHTGERPYQCKICDKSFGQSNTLRTHMTLHTGKTIPCPICGKMFSRRSNLIVHNREHTGEKPYVCESCGRPFSQKCHLDTHRLSHQAERQFKCEICNKEYIQKSTLKTHMFSHFGRPIKCNFPDCTRTFIKKSLLRSHMKSIHGITIETVDDVSFITMDPESNDIDNDHTETINAVEELISREESE